VEDGNIGEEEKVKRYKHCKNLEHSTVFKGELGYIFFPMKKSGKKEMKYPERKVIKTTNEDQRIQKFQDCPQEMNRNNNDNRHSCYSELDSESRYFTKELDAGSSPV